MYTTSAAAASDSRTAHDGWVRIVEWLSHWTVAQEVPGSYPGAAEKCWAVMELFVNIYLYEFVLTEFGYACVFVVSFVLIELRH